MPAKVTVLVLAGGQWLDAQQPERFGIAVFQTQVPYYFNGLRPLTQGDACRIRRSSIAPTPIGL